MCCRNWRNQKARDSLNPQVRKRTCCDVSVLGAVSPESIGCCFILFSNAKGGASSWRALPIKNERVAVAVNDYSFLPFAHS